MTQKLTEIPKDKLEVCKPGIARGIYPGSTINELRRKRETVRGVVSSPFSRTNGYRPRRGHT